MQKEAIRQEDFSIRTKRLVLVPVEDAHAAFYRDGFTAEVTRYQYPEPFLTLEGAQAFISASKAFRLEGEALVLTMLGADGAFLGSVEARNLTSPTPEVGLWLKEGAQGMGYGKEAMQAFLAFLRESFPIDFFVYETDRRNEACLRLAAALGGAYECAYDVVSAGGELLRLKLFYII